MKRAGIRRAVAWRAAVAVAASLLALTALAQTAQAAPVAQPHRTCFDPRAVGAAARSPGAAGRSGRDTPRVSATEQREIAARTRRLLAARSLRSPLAAVPGQVVSIPVYVHVMRDARGRGNVTTRQIADQIAVLNATFGGRESSTAANTGFAFRLAGTDRFRNTRWHNDLSSGGYRARTRKGGANALNLWVVDFPYLGIATFPWDYRATPRLDGVRVSYRSFPGGPRANYNLGKTATHETGHWLGLFHTFRGGCTAGNDQVTDTPAQSTPTTGCPQGRDSCSQPGLDPINNYMDYSFDRCYNEYTAGQSARMAAMWTAYRSPPVPS